MFLYFLSFFCVRFFAEAADFFPQKLPTPIAPFSRCHGFVNSSRRFPRAEPPPHPGNMVYFFLPSVRTQASRGYGRPYGFPHGNLARTLMDTYSPLQEEWQVLGKSPFSLRAYSLDYKLFFLLARIQMVHSFWEWWSPLSPCRLPRPSFFPSKN